MSSSRVVQWTATWGVLALMTGIYAVLAVTSDATTTVKAWMAIGLGFVFVVWFVVRYLMHEAALARATSVGDVPRVLELTSRALARARSDAAKAPLLVHAALAHELAGDHVRATAALDGLRLEALRGRRRAVLQIQAAAVRISCHLAAGEPAAARAMLERDIQPALSALDPRLDPLPHHHAGLASGRVQIAEGRVEEGRAVLRSLIDDVRASPAIRARALQAQNVPDKPTPT